MTHRRQNFMGGAAILAGAVAVTKLLGALYKIPKTVQDASAMSRWQDPTGSRVLQGVAGSDAADAGSSAPRVATGRAAVDSGFAV